jgi:hypothetical protein
MIILHIRWQLLQVLVPGFNQVEFCVVFGANFYVLGELFEFRNQVYDPVKNGNNNFLFKSFSPTRDFLGKPIGARKSKYCCI